MLQRASVCYLDSSSARPAEARTAFMMVARKAPVSRACTPAMVVPALRRSLMSYAAINSIEVWFQETSEDQAGIC